MVWEPGTGYATNLLCDHMEIRFPLWVSVSYSIKYNDFFPPLQKYMIPAKTRKRRRGQREEKRTGKEDEQKGQKCVCEERKRGWEREEMPLNKLKMKLWVS